jgi:hypothetical protein
MAIPAARNLTEPEMKKQAQVLRQRADAIDAMLAKRDLDRTKALREAERRREEEASKKAKLWFPDKSTHDFDYPQPSVPDFGDASDL